MKTKTKTIAALIIYVILLSLTIVSAILLMVPPELNRPFWINLTINILLFIGTILIRLRLRKKSLPYCRVVLIILTALLFFSFVYWSIQSWIGYIYNICFHFERLPDVTEIWAGVLIDIEHIILLLCNALCFGIKAHDDDSAAGLKRSYPTGIER